MSGTFLTREQAFVLLARAGFPTGVYTTNLDLAVPASTLMVAIACAESDLKVEAQGLPNSDGTIDRGWLQVNSTHGWDPARLLSDPAYTAQCGLQILLQQGFRAWAAYNVRNAKGVYPYARRMPPGMGGPVVGVGTDSCREINKTVQTWLNAQLPVGALGLVVDGDFGPKSEAALFAARGVKVVDGANWRSFGLR